MKIKSLLILLLFGTWFNPLQAQERKPDWRKMHYLSEEEMHQPLNKRDFYETDPPAGPVKNVAEFDQMQAVLVRYPFGVPVSLIKDMADDLEVITIVANSAEEQTVTTQYTNNGVNLDNCSFLYALTNSYWVRDYGPWFVFDGNGNPGIVNFPYNRPRPYDNDIPIKVAQYLDIDLYGMNLTSTGGNYMTTGMGQSASTELIEEENPGLTEEDIDTLVSNYLGIENYYIVTDPLGEYIKHIDCWGKFLSPGKVLIGQVPESDDRYDDFEATANFFKATNSPYGVPYEVFRVFTPGSPIATPYTNSLILNNKVFVPLTGSDWDDDAIASYQEAMPGYNIIGITYGGWINTDALHCRTKGVADLGMLYINHVPVLGTIPYQDSINLTADIYAYSGDDIYSDSVLIYYSIDSGDYQVTNMSLENGNTWTGYITGLNPGDDVDYYLYAADKSGRHATHPYIGEPDPHEFTVISFFTDDLELDPDTLLFLTPSDCFNGLPLYIVNISTDTVEISGITPGSNEFSGFDWWVQELPELPYYLPVGDTLTLKVLVGIPVTMMGEMLQDTIVVETTDDSFSSLIMVDSDLLGAGEIQEEYNVEVYPNPFNERLNFNFRLNKATQVSLQLYDLSGKTIYNEIKSFPAGKHTVSVNAARLKLTPGTYLYRLQTGEEVKTGKVVFD
ncbi:MAG TPA: T9SS type A sorting domain-containing protein [Bacteroidetes bacterium]|nr:T9SS type A sorting domain-containing protein [Bacteroidota bacterium]